MTKKRVKFYSIGDLGAMMYLSRMQEVLNEFLIRPTDPHNITDAIEFQNIIRFIENGMFSRDWDSEYIEKIKNVKNELKKRTAKFLGTVDKGIILDSLSSLGWEYYDDFFVNYERYDFAKKIPEEDFEK